MSGFQPWVLATLILSALPSLLRLPLWVAGVALAGTALHYAGSFRNGWTGRLASFAMLAGAAAGIWISFGSFFTGNAVLSFFITVVFLKWGESHTRRDYLLLIFAAVILAAVGALYFENLLSLIHMLVVVFSLTMSLTAIHMDPAALGRNLLFKTAGKMFVLGLPLMLLLFMTFPRIPGPIWDLGIAFGLPIKALMDRGGGDFGKTMTLQPGGIHRATEDNENVLVAEFKGVVPFLSRLYWRGPVFWEFDGVTWTLPEAWDNRNTLLQKAIRSQRKLDYELVYKEEPVEYTLRVMPNGGRWLYGLDVPAAPAPEAFISSEFQLLSIRNIDDHEPKFEMLSYLEYRTGKRLSPEQRQKGLAFPENTNPRLLALGQKLKAEHKTVDAVVHQGLRLLAQGDYTYDAAYMIPPGPDMLDRYFFDEKRGGAEYLAGSFAMLMRAAGIPARLVSGFRGGTVIALTNFVIVKQANAHAWLEIWEDDKGWKRVEPKDIVQPPGKEKVKTEPVKEAAAEQQVRITPAPAEQPAPARAEKPSEKQPVPSQKKDSAWHLPSWASLFGNFQKWVINYDPDRQMELFKGVGMEKSNWLDLMITGIAGVAGILGIYLAGAWYRGREKTDRVTRAWKRFCSRMEKKFGLKKSAHECPGDYLARISAEQPELATAVGDIISRYIEIRYAKNDSGEACALFRRQVERFVSMT